MFSHDGAVAIESPFSLTTFILSAERLLMYSKIKVSRFFEMT